MAALTVQARSADPTFVAASVGGDTMRNDGATELLVSNVGVSSVNVTITATGRCRHGFLDNEVVACAPGELTSLGPWDAARFNNSTGSVAISYSSVVGITVAARKQR